MVKAGGGLRSWSAGRAEGPVMLLDRLAGREVLRRLLEAAPGGRRGVLVVRGVSGVGKMALLKGS